MLQLKNRLSYKATELITSYLQQTLDHACYVLIELLWVPIIGRIAAYCATLCIILPFFIIACACPTVRFLCAYVGHTYSLCRGLFKFYLTTCGHFVSMTT